MLSKSHVRNQHFEKQNIHHMLSKTHHMAFRRRNECIPHLLSSVFWRRLLIKHALSSFQDLGADSVISRRLRMYGITEPTYIQTKVYDAFTKKLNFVINSETGSGKTLAYAVPIVQKIRDKEKKGVPPSRPSALILAPNTELCYQIGDVFRSILAAKTCVVSNDLPLRLIDTDVVVATPQHIMMYPLNVLKETQTIVIDEADIIIARKEGKHGKRDSLFNLIGHFLNSNKESGDELKKQFAFVGATMPDSKNLKSKKAVPYIRSWFPDVEVLRGNDTHKMSPTSEISFLRVESGNKVNLLMKVLSDFAKSSARNAFNVIIYTNSVQAAEDLHNRLTNPSSGITYYNNDSNESELSIAKLFQQFHEIWSNHVHMIHRNISKDERMHLFNIFSTSSYSILITTDIASRGLDFQNVGLVVQYDFATNYVDVIHRSGRTGRMGRKGLVVNFVSERDKEFAVMVQNKYLKNESAEVLFSRRRGLTRKMKTMSGDQAM